MPDNLPRTHPNTLNYKNVPLLIMIPTGNNRQSTSINGVNQPIRIVDLSRPESGKILFQGFWFARFGKRTSQRIANRFVDAPECLSILTLLVNII